MFRFHYNYFHKKIFFFLSFFLSFVDPCSAIQAIHINSSLQVFDISENLEKITTNNNFVQISTAPDANNIIRRLEVKSHLDIVGENYKWVAFALTNDTQEQIEKLIVVPHYKLSGSGFLWPDLDSVRIKNITVSDGFPPELESTAFEDIFRIIIEPGSTITYIAELDFVNLTQVKLWDIDSYKEYKSNFNVLLGIILSLNAFIIILILTIYFIKGSKLALITLFLALTVIFIVFINFDMALKFFNLSTGFLKFLRSLSEFLLLISCLTYFIYCFNIIANVQKALLYFLSIFLFTFIIVICYYFPEIISGLSRIVLLFLAFFGLVFNIYLILSQRYKYIIFLPSWFCLFFWTDCFFLTINGYINNDIISIVLYSYLVLQTLLISFISLFIVFNSFLYDKSNNKSDRNSLALSCSGEYVFEYDINKDKLFLSSDFEFFLGFEKEAFCGPLSTFLSFLYPSDRVKLIFTLNNIIVQKNGFVNFEFRIFSNGDVSYNFLLRARPVISSDNEVFKLVGLLSNITEYISSKELIIKDSLFDNELDLPNIKLLVDNLNIIIINKLFNKEISCLILLEIDDFVQLCSKFNIDDLNFLVFSFLARLKSILLEADRIYKIKNGRFAFYIYNLNFYKDINSLVEKLKSITVNPIIINKVKITISFSMGITIFNKEFHYDALDFINETEDTLHRAQSLGRGRVELSSNKFNATKNISTIKEELLNSFENSETILLFKPIVKIDSRSIIGFNIFPRWRHQNFGRLLPHDFFDLVSDNNLSSRFTEFLMLKVVKEIQEWNSLLDVDPPLFATFNLSPILNNVLILETIKEIIYSNKLSTNCIKLEFSTGNILRQTEKSLSILRKIHDDGFNLVLDAFGNSCFSLNSLQRFKFEYVRFDKSLIQANLKGYRSPILKPLVKLFHNLDIKVIADGVENEKDISDLTFCNCDLAQGLAFGDGLTFLEARKLISNIY